MKNTSQTSVLYLFLALALVALAGCGPAFPKSPTTTGPGTPAGPSSIRVSYEFQGVETPLKTTIRIIDGAAVGGQSCGTLPYRADTGVLTEQSGLPVTGQTVFTNVPDGSRWIVWAVGYDFNGQRVASACQDLVSASADTATDVYLQLNNDALHLQGPYTTQMEIALFDLDSTAISIIGLACSLVQEIPPDVCSDVIDALLVMQDLDIETVWNFQQSGDTFSGTVEWTKLEGVNVSVYPVDLASGFFSAEVPGATGLDVKTFQMNLELAHIVIFIIEDVLGQTIPGGSTTQSVVLFLSPYLQGQLTVPTGEGLLVDADQDGKTDQLSGILQAHTDFPQLGIDTNFDITFAGTRN